MDLSPLKDASQLSHFMIDQKMFLYWVGDPLSIEQLPNALQFYYDKISFRPIDVIDELYLTAGSLPIRRTTSENLICIISKQKIPTGVDYIKCAFCSYPMIYKYATEWIRTKGRCPQCTKRVLLEWWFPQD